jgi:hypothetical protein
MVDKKSDIVRRSLFGTSQALPDEEQSDFSDVRATRTTRQRNAGARRTLPPVVELATEVGLVAPAGRRAVERTAVTVPTNLLMQVKDAVAVLNGWPQQYTMARFVEEAFAAQLERLKVEHNGGRDFPITNRKIRTGRPPGT